MSMQVSPDGMWAWDGARWIPTPPTPPPPPIAPYPPSALIGRASPDGRWTWNGMQWVPNPLPAAPAAASAIPRPSGLILFRGYCIVVAVVLIGLGTLGLIGLIAYGFDPAAFDTSAAALALTTFLFVYVLAEGVLAVIAVIAPRRRWGWITGLVVIVLGLLGITLVVAVPLLVYWTRPEMRTYYGMRA